MPNELTHVVVSIHVASSNPILPIITVEEALIDGAGTLVETIQGGQVRQVVELAHGRELKALAKGQLVYLRGKQNGQPFLGTTAFTTENATRPWVFTRVSGSTG